MDAVFELIYEVLVSSWLHHWYLEFRCRIEDIQSRPLKLFLKALLALCAVLIPFIILAAFVLLVFLIIHWTKA